MNQIVFVTGATGALGPDLLRGLALGDESREIWVLRHRADPRARSISGRVVSGDVRLPDLGLDPKVAESLRQRARLIVHAAADTRQASSLASMRMTNVGGVNHAIAFARRCSKLERFIHVSATCAAGDLRGMLWETPWTEIPTFVNAYQQTKWEAERFVRESGLPWEILRLAEIAGSQRTGVARRLGSFHQFLFWVYKGFLPVIPASPHSRCDFLSSEFVALVLSRLLQAPGQTGRIVHVSRGDQAPYLTEVLEAITEALEQLYPQWRHGRRHAPTIVDEEAYRFYQDTIARSRHPLFLRIMESGSHFLPSMLQAKVYRTDQLRRLLEGEARRETWQELLRQVLGHLAATNWGLDASPSPRELEMR